MCLLADFKMKICEDRQNKFPFDIELESLIQKENMNEGNLSSCGSENDGVISLVVNILTGILFILSKSQKINVEQHEKLKAFLNQNN